MSGDYVPDAGESLRRAIRDIASAIDFATDRVLTTVGSRSGIHPTRAALQSGNLNATSRPGEPTRTTTCCRPSCRYVIMPYWPEAGSSTRPTCSPVRLR